MSELDVFTYNSLTTIAAAFIDGLPTCSVHYVFSEKFHRHVLMVVDSGLFLGEVRCWLSANIYVKYGDTQDTIIFIDENVL